ncbi:MAG: CbiX/SirB N-terminal domain-containing protein [Nocardioidaceae bacterium]
MRHLLVAHGSPDPRHAAFVRSLAAGVSRLGVPTEAAFLEHDLPDVRSWLSRVREPVTTLGLLLAPGYHAQVDVPRLIRTAPAGVPVTDLGVLGSGPWLFGVVDELVSSVGGDPTTPVALVSAGSSRAEAATHLRAFADGWAATRPGPVRLTAPDGLAGVAGTWADPVVLPFLVAPGVIGDRIVGAADRLGLRATPVLGVADRFPEVLASRLTGGLVGRALAG